MKLITFELAGKKEAKRCRSVADIVALGKKVKYDRYYDVNNDTDVTGCISTELYYLISNPKFAFNMDIPEKIDLIDPCNYNGDLFGLRIIHENGDVRTIVYEQQNKWFRSTFHYIKNNSLYCRSDGHFKVDSDDIYNAHAESTKYEADFIQAIEYSLRYQAYLMRSIITGRLELKPVDYVPIVKYGRYHIKPSGIVRHRKPCLVASHDRAGHFKVLRSPRYYPDGIVPENESELRRVPVKPCHVKRDIERVQVNEL